MNATMLGLLRRWSIRHTRAAPRQSQWFAAGVVALLASVAHAAPVDVDADIIWDDNDARGKCPRVCSAKNLYWAGTWRKTGWAASYVCSCDDKAPPAAPPTRPGGASVFPFPMPGVPQVAPVAPAPVQVQFPGGTVLRYDYTDFHNAGDLRSASSPSYETCAGMCLAAPDCGAFTFAADQHNCYLKSGAGNLQRANAAASGVVMARGSAPPAVYPAMSPAPAPAPSCSIGSTQKCPGCSVTCAPGQTPVCDQAVEGVTSTCARNASCRCS
jgi:hypothetical protein